MAADKDKRTPKQATDLFERIIKASVKDIKPTKPKAKKRINKNK